MPNHQLYKYVYLEKMHLAYHRVTIARYLNYGVQQYSKTCLLITAILT